MFDNPTDSSGSFIEPGRYVVKIVKLEPQPPSAEHPDWKPSVRMILNLATYPALERKMDPSDPTLPYEWWQYLSTAMGKGTKTRQKVEAFLGRPLVEGQDTGAAIAEALIGAKAIAMIGLNEKGKDAILGALQPYTEPPARNGRGKAAPVSAAVAALEDDLPPAQRTSTVATDDADVPF